ncbi:MAG TPA: AraC family transcriptional regulator [Polyangiaceae bacterium]|nr:AraC family transcriptional regulator [Polyangiaceae bacterium]
MPLWEAEFNFKVRAFRHRVAPGFGHALLMAAQGFVFESLGVSAALWLAGDDWFPLHSERGVMAFESAPGIDSQRGPYNRRSFAKVQRTRLTLQGEHNGFSDFFVPVVKGREVVAILTVGPFARSRATAAEIQERWRKLTGRPGHPSDPFFAGYLAATLATIVLDAAQTAALRRLLESWVSLAIQEGDPAGLANAIERDRVLLDAAHLVDRQWDTVREMIDERFTHVWQTHAITPNLVFYGLPRVPDGVLVGLAMSQSDASSALEEIVQRNALQRAVVDFVRRDKVLAGRVGDHGIVLLAITKGSERQRMAQLGDLGFRVASWARRNFSVTLHFGTGEAPAHSTLATRYRIALAATQSALLQKKDLVVTRVANQSSTSLSSMRRSLDRLLAETPERLPVEFDRYLEVVLSACGHRFEAARAHAELGFERLLDVLARQNVLDERSLDTIRADLEGSVMSAGTLNETFDHYRRAIRNLAKASRAPVSARHERSLQRALTYIDQHYTEPLRLAQVARITGFESSYFSRLFIQEEGLPFSRYLTRKRLERAKQLLTSTDFNLARVATLSGFPAAAYLCTAFKRATGVTPKRWRVENPTHEPRRKAKRKH